MGPASDLVASVHPRAHRLPHKAEHPAHGLTEAPDPNDPSRPSRIGPMSDPSWVFYARHATGAGQNSDRLSIFSKQTGFETWHESRLRFCGGGFVGAACAFNRIPSRRWGARADRLNCVSVSEADEPMLEKQMGWCFPAFGQQCPAGSAWALARRGAWDPKVWSRAGVGTPSCGVVQVVAGCTRNRRLFAFLFDQGETQSKTRFASPMGTTGKRGSLSRGGHGDGCALRAAIQGGRAHPAARGARAGQA